MTFDIDRDDAKKEQLRAIEVNYATTKRKTSDFDGDVNEESSTCRRILPRPAIGTSPSVRSAHNHLPEDGHHANKIDRSHGYCTRNALRNSNRTPCQVNLKQKLPIFTFDGRTVYSRSLAEVEQATVEILDKIEQLKHNADEISLGFDMEWKPNFRKGQAAGKTAVLQICMDSSDCYIMHIIHSGVPPILKSLLEDPSYSKVGIGITGDAAKISREYNVCVTSLVDLSSFANIKLGGVPKKWGLCSLSEMLACKELLKPSKIRMGNWEVSELSKEQIQYAATDAFASLFLYQVLKTFPDIKPET